MATNGNLVGLECKLYRNTGTYGTPVWSEVDVVKNNTLSVEKGEASFGSRGTGGWDLSKGTLKKGTLEFELIYDRGDTNCAAIEDAFFSDTIEEYAIMDGDIATTGSHGMRIAMEVFNFSRAEGLEDPVTCSVTLKPSISANAPAAYTAS